MNIQWLRPSPVQEIKRGRATALAERGQEVRVTAVEPFDLRVLINEDYGLRICVSPDFGTSARRRQHSQLLVLKTMFLDKSICIYLISARMCRMDFTLGEWLKSLQLTKERVFISIELNRRIMKMTWTSVQINSNVEIFPFYWHQMGFIVSLKPDRESICPFIVFFG